MNVKFNGTNKVLESFNIILKKDEKTELSFEFDDWKVLIGLIFKEDNELETSKFHWELENISNFELENLPVDEINEVSEEDIPEMIRPLFICTNWNKSQTIYEPQTSVGEHEQSGELRVRISVRYKNGFYEANLMFYAANQKSDT